MPGLKDDLEKNKNVIPEQAEHKIEQKKPLEELKAEKRLLGAKNPEPKSIEIPTISLEILVSPEKVQEYANLGADLNRVLDEEGNTVLHLVKDPAVAKALIEAGATFKKNESGNTPLHTCQNSAVMQVFIDKGLITKKNDEGNCYASLLNDEKELPFYSLLKRLKKSVDQKEQSSKEQEKSALSDEINDLENAVKLLAFQGLDLSKDLLKLFEYSNSLTSPPFPYFLAEMGLPGLVDLFMDKKIGKVPIFYHSHARDYMDPLQLGVEKLSSLKKERKGEKKGSDRAKALEQEIVKQRLVVKKLIDFNPSWTQGGFSNFSDKVYGLSLLVENEEFDLVKHALSAAKAATTKDNAKEYKIENLKDQNGNNPFYSATKLLKKLYAEKEALEVKRLLAIVRNNKATEKKSEKSLKNINQRFIDQKSVVNAFLDYNVNLNVNALYDEPPLVYVVLSEDLELIQRIFKHRKIGEFVYSSLSGKLLFAIEGAFQEIFNQRSKCMDERSKRKNPEIKAYYAARIANQEEILFLILEQAMDIKKDPDVFSSMISNKLGNSHVRSSIG